MRTQAIAATLDHAAPAAWWVGLSAALPVGGTAALAACGVLLALTGAWSLVGAARSTIPDPTGLRGALVRLWLGAIMALVALAFAPGTDALPQPGLAAQAAEG